ncbi:hypothetical protein [Arenimonas terrae]|uniref:Uncharacterized protein n=1 Tax=Arenimonas terrae TaxID=2546226 RepID=A0A5C4RXQ7_9GAMM|nr:hypothetical protein [Arenimonas terrae]TNJ35782.1 hypothetical protein E1B00_08570 [Arenimonas terrae]
MPYFRVRVEGRGISVQMENSIAVGFFATRAVRARSEEDAVEKVRSMFAEAWTTGQYAEWNRGVAPTLLIDDVWPSPWFQNIFFVNDGHSFFPDEPGEGEA